MSAESKRQALGNDFPERICHMFLISKCRGDGDLGLCTASVLAFGEPMRSGDFQQKRVSTQEKSDFAIALQFSNASPKVKQSGADVVRAAGPQPHFRIMPWPPVLISLQSQ